MRLCPHEKKSGQTRAEGRPRGDTGRGDAVHTPRREASGAGGTGQPTVGARALASRRFLSQWPEQTHAGPFLRKHTQNGPGTGFMRNRVCAETGRPVARTAIVRLAVGATPRTLCTVGGVVLPGGGFRVSFRSQVADATRTGPSSFPRLDAGHGKAQRGHSATRQFLLISCLCLRGLGARDDKMPPAPLVLSCPAENRTLPGGPGKGGPGRPQA